MADYRTARDTINSILLGASIISPSPMGIAEAHPYMPDGEAVNLFPCTIITGFQSRYARGVGRRERLITVGIRLGVQPDYFNPATDVGDILDAFKEAIPKLFDAGITLGLGGTYQVLEGPNWIRNEPIYDGGRRWDDAELIIKLDEAASYIA